MGGDVAMEMEAGRGERGRGWEYSWGGGVGGVEEEGGKGRGSHEDGEERNSERWDPMQPISIAGVSLWQTTQAPLPLFAKDTPTSG